MEIENRLWVIGTVIVIAAVAAMGWFVGISPVLDTVAANNEQRSVVETQNLAQASKLTAIKKEFDNIDDLKAQLAELRTVIPSSDDLSTFIGQLHQLEELSSVKLAKISTSDGEVFVPPVAAKAPVAEGATAQEPKADPKIAAVSKDNLIVIPISLEVTGAHEQVMNFIDALQKGTRLFLVTKLTVTGDASGSDSYTGAISGYAYVLLDSGNLAETDAPTLPTGSGK